MDFYSIFHRQDMPLLGSANIDWETVDASDWYVPLQEYYRKVWESGKADLLCKSSASFIVLGDNVIIGPLSSVRRITYSDAPSSELARLGSRVSVSPLYLSKIASVLTQKGSDTLSAEELAFCLDLTPAAPPAFSHGWRPEGWPPCSITGS